MPPGAKPRRGPAARSPAAPSQPAPGYGRVLTCLRVPGPLGTSGAQNVIPPIPKGPRAVRATPWGRNGGDFEIFSPRRLHHCSNSTSGTRTATEVTDAWVKHENCATNTGLNNGQEDEKTGTWRWVVLPTIVAVTHLGDLDTMRRWFGGSCYAH